jgi:hypothetical protein
LLPSSKGTGAITITGAMAVGRGRKAGDRYPSGKLKPTGNKPAIEPFAPALIQRIKRGAKNRWEDARLGSEVGILLMSGELTAAQAAAAFRIASIYGAYEHYAGLHRSSASPSYDAARGDPLLGPDAQEKRDARENSATKTFLKLQSEIPVTLRSAVEQLIVEDRLINSLLYHSLRTFLDQLAAKWRGERQQNESVRRDGPPLHFNQHENETSEIQQALKDRARFRLEKTRL